MASQEPEPAVSFEAMNVNVERQPDIEHSQTHTESGGYEITAIGAENQEHRTFHATALNVNGMAIAGNFSIGEHNETITLVKETEGDGGYMNLVLSR